MLPLLLIYSKTIVKSGLLVLCLSGVRRFTLITALALDVTDRCKLTLHYEGLHVALQY